MISLKLILWAKQPSFKENKSQEKYLRNLIILLVYNKIIKFWELFWIHKARFANAFCSVFWRLREREKIVCMCLIGKKKQSLSSYIEVGIDGGVTLSMNPLQPPSNRSARLERNTRQMQTTNFGPFTLPRPCPRPWAAPGGPLLPSSGAILLQRLKVNQSERMWEMNVFFSFSCYHVRTKMK